MFFCFYFLYNRVQDAVDERAAFGRAVRLAISMYSLSETLVGIDSKVQISESATCMMIISMKAMRSKSHFGVLLDQCPVSVLV